MSNLKEEIKNKILTAGFSSVGFTNSEELTDDKFHLKTWLERDLHGEMKFMERYFDKRTNPQLLIEGARTVIVCLANYKPSANQNKRDYKIAKYAYGKDYHYVLKEKLKNVIEYLNSSFPESSSRCFVDSAPILEKTLAVKAGLGWIGKNTLLMNRENGSFQFIAVIITTIPVESDLPFANEYCGSCTKCINACPTNALIAPKVLDSNKCISYLTIEYRNELPSQFKKKMADNIFGCDICQNVCPWNKKSEPTKIKEFEPHPNLLSMNKNNWQNLSRSEYKLIFKNSAVERARFKNLKRNIKFLSEI